MNKDLINFIINLFNNNVDRAIRSEEDWFELRLNYPNDLIEYEKIKALKHVKDIVLTPFTSDVRNGITLTFYLQECSPKHAALRIKLRTERSSVPSFSVPTNSSLNFNEAEVCWISKMTDDLLRIVPIEFGTLTIDRSVDGYISLKGLIMDELSIIDIKSLDHSFIRSVNFKKNGTGKIEVKVTSNICNKKRAAAVAASQNTIGNNNATS